MKIGRIKIEADLYENNYDYVKRIFELVRPTQIEFDWHGQIYHIWCISELFEDSPSGFVNDYIFNISTDKVNFEKL